MTTTTALLLPDSHSFAPVLEMVTEYLAAANEIVANLEEQQLDNVTLKRRMADKEDEIAKLKQMRTTERANSAASLALVEERITALTEHNEKLKEHNAELEARNVSLREIIESKMAQLQQQQQDNHSVSSTPDTNPSSLTRLSQRVTLATNRLNTMRETADKLTEKATEMHTWTNEFSGVMQQVHTVKENLDVEMRRLQTRNAELERLVDERNRALRMAQYDCETATAQFDRATNELMEERRMRMAIHHELETFKIYVSVHLEPLLAARRENHHGKPPPPSLQALLPDGCVVAAGDNDAMMVPDLPLMEDTENNNENGTQMLRLEDQ